MTFVPDYALDSLKVTYGKPTVACPLTAFHTNTHTHTFQYFETDLPRICVCVCRVQNRMWRSRLGDRFYTTCSHIWDLWDVVFLKRYSLWPCVVLQQERRRRTNKTWQTLSENFGLNEMFTLKGHRTYGRTPHLDWPLGNIKINCLIRSILLAKLIVFI